MHQKMMVTFIIPDKLYNIC